MPPKAKFTRNEIIQAGRNIISENRVGALSARALAAKLNSSARPIFTVFQSMEEVQAEVKQSAKSLYAEYAKKGFEQEQESTVENVLPVKDESYKDILLSVQKRYQISENERKQLYRHLWIYTHGIVVFCATNMCVFASAEIDKMITQVFRGIMKEIHERNS